MVRASMLVGYVMDSAIKRLVAGGALMSGCRDLLAKCFAVALIMCAIGSIRYLEIDSAGAAEPQVGLILSRAEQASLAGSAGSEALESDGWGFETRQKKRKRKRKTTGAGAGAMMMTTTGAGAAGGMMTTTLAQQPLPALLR
jgi:hypothetical protein